MKKIRIIERLLLIVSCSMLLAACGKKQEGEGDVSTTGGGFSQKIGEDGQVGAMLPLEGKALGEMSVVGEEDAVYCNLPENVRGWETIIPVCVDPLYGILYYVDYGGDYMIHAVYNGKSQIALELPGKRLFCRRGKLYFLLESYNRFGFEGARSGNIVEYDPVTGDVRILTDQTFTSMVVYQDMIYCRRQGGEIDYTGNEEIYVDEESSWFYFFDTGELVAGKDAGREYVMDFRRYGEYFLAAALGEYKEDPRYDIQTGTELRKWDGEQGTVWEGVIFMPSDRHYIKDGNFQWVDTDGFHIWNPVSGENKDYRWIFKRPGQYVLVGEWLLSAEYQLVNTEQGQVEKWSSADEELKMIHELYTDGDRIYAIAGLFGSEVDANSFLRQVEITQGEERYELRFKALGK